MLLLTCFPYLLLLPVMYIAVIKSVINSLSVNEFETDNATSFTQGASLFLLLSECCWSFHVVLKYISRQNTYSMMFISTGVGSTYKNIMLIELSVASKHTRFNVTKK